VTVDQLLASIAREPLAVQLEQIEGALWGQKVDPQPGRTADDTARLTEARLRIMKKLGRP
jgi:hypothetical protein